MGWVRCFVTSSWRWACDAPILIVRSSTDILPAYYLPQVFNPFFRGILVSIPCRAIGFNFLWIFYQHFINGHGGTRYFPMLSIGIIHSNSLLSLLVGGLWCACLHWGLTLRSGWSRWIVLIFFEIIGILSRRPRFHRATTTPLLPIKIWEIGLLELGCRLILLNFNCAYDYQSCSDDIWDFMRVLSLEQCYLPCDVEIESWRENRFLVRGFVYWHTHHITWKGELYVV